MTVAQILANIIDWVRTGIPLNVKSSNMRTLLTWMTKRMDVQEPGRLKILKKSGNVSIEMELGDRVTGVVENTFIFNAIYLGGNTSLLASYFIINNSGGSNPREHIYDDINSVGQLLDDQANQTAGFLQEVLDASDDPEVDSGRAIYLYLGTTNGSLQDYVLLTADEVIAVISPITYREFPVKDIVESLPAIGATGQVFLQKDGSNRITGVLFDAVFTQYLHKYKEVYDTATTMYIKLYNKTQHKTLIASVTGFSYSDVSNTYYIVSMTVGNTTADVAVADILEVYFDIDLVGEDVDLAPYMLTATYAPTIAEHTAQIAAITTSYSRRKTVIDIVNNTVAPPTELTNDRYILDFTAGTTHASWDGAAKGRIVTFNGTIWTAEAPIEGWITYLDAQNKDALYVDDGVPEWQIRAVGSGGEVLETDFNANTILAANADDTPLPLEIAEAGILLRPVGGNIKSGTPAEAKAILEYVNSTTTGEPSGSDVVVNIVSLTQAELDAGTQVPGTTYVVTDAKEDVVFMVPCSDETTVITTGTYKYKFRLPFGITLTDVKADLNDADDALFTVVVLENGVQAAEVTIDTGETTSVTATTPRDISNPNLAYNAEISFDVTTAGTAATGLKVTLYGKTT